MKRNRHEWKKNTDEGRRLYRAWTDRGGWQIESAPDTGRASRRKTDDPESGLDWQIEENPTLEDLLLFREILWNKYRRGRVAYKFVEKLDAMIEEAEKAEPPQVESEEFSSGNEEN